MSFPGLSLIEHLRDMLDQEIYIYGSAADKSVMRAVFF